MLVNKVTSGFVVQQFDTTSKKFVSQEFIAGESCDYEDTDGETVDCGLLQVNEQEVYLPFDMVQPVPQPTAREKRILEYALNFLSANLDEDCLYDMFPKEAINVEAVAKEINDLAENLQ